MPVRSIVRNLLVGQSHISSRLEFKSAMLRGYIASLALIVVVAYMIIDSRHGLVENNPYYVTVGAVALLTIALNRRHRFQLANLLFLFMINFLLFLFGNADIYRTGIYMYFICISIAAFALYGFKYVQYAVLFSLLSLTLFLMSYFGELSILPTPVYTEAYITISFITNFLMVLVLAVLIVYFLINLNHHSEQDLIRASEELHKSRERNEMVVVAVDAGIYEWKHIEQTIFISATWKKLLGYGEEELQNLDLPAYYSIIHPDDKENVEQNIAAHLKTRKAYANEVRLRKKDGSYFWFLDSGNTKFNGQGIPTITVGSIFDINNRKLAEEKILKQNELLAKANKELDQFVYSVSHDLRAPLSSILGLANIYDLSADKTEKENIIRLIRDRANTLDDFIKEILDYSRNSRTDLKVQPVNVLKLITEVINGLRYMQGFDRIEIETLIPQDLEVKTDRERLKVIMSNLIANSVKYQDKGKEPFIRISSSRAHHDGLSLFVKDNGIGIELEHQGRIFDMFYQAHDHAHGSGLGLYIAKEAVQRLQGKIDVHSEFQVGTTFTVTLPVGG